MKGLWKLLDSSVFIYCALIQIATAIIVINTEPGTPGSITWVFWFTESVVMLGIYASKEGIRYGAEAYGKSNV